MCYLRCYLCATYATYVLLIIIGVSCFLIVFECQVFVFVAYILDFLSGLAALRVHQGGSGSAACVQLLVFICVYS